VNARETSVVLFDANIIAQSVFCVGLLIIYHYLLHCIMTARPQ